MSTGAWRNHKYKDKKYVNGKWYYDYGDGFDYSNGETNSERITRLKADHEARRKLKRTELAIKKPINKYSREVKFATDRAMLDTRRAANKTRLKAHTTGVKTKLGIKRLGKKSEKYLRKYSKKLKRDIRTLGKNVQGRFKKARYEIGQAYDAASNSKVAKAARKGLARAEVNTRAAYYKTRRKVRTGANGVRTAAKKYASKGKSYIRRLFD